MSAGNMLISEESLAEMLAQWDDNEPAEPVSAGQDKPPFWPSFARYPSPTADQASATTGTNGIGSDGGGGGDASPVEDDDNAHEEPSDDDHPVGDETYGPPVLTQANRDGCPTLQDLSDLATSRGPFDSLDAGPGRQSSQTSGMQTISPSSLHAPPLSPGRQFPFGASPSSDTYDTEARPLGPQHESDDHALHCPSPGDVDEPSWRSPPASFVTSVSAPLPLELRYDHRDQPHLLYHQQYYQQPHAPPPSFDSRYPAQQFPLAVQPWTPPTPQSAINPLPSLPSLYDLPRQSCHSTHPVSPESPLGPSFGPHATPTRASHVHSHGSLPQALLSPNDLHADRRLPPSVPDRHPSSPFLNVQQAPVASPTSVTTPLEANVQNELKAPQQFSLSLAVRADRSTTLQLSTAVVPTSFQLLQTQALVEEEMMRKKHKSKQPKVKNPKPKQFKAKTNSKDESKIPREQCKNACSECQRRRKRCDEVGRRPCPRCIKLQGLVLATAMCRDSERSAQKRGQAKISSGSAAAPKAADDVNVPDLVPQAAVSSALTSPEMSPAPTRAPSPAGAAATPRGRTSSPPKRKRGFGPIFAALKSEQTFVDAPGASAVAEKATAPSPGFQPLHEYPTRANKSLQPFRP